MINFLSGKCFEWKRECKICLLLLTYAASSVAKNQLGPTDTTTAHKNNLKFGLTIGCGITTFKGGVKAINPLVRPDFQFVVQQTISPKSILQYKAMYRLFGFKRRSGSVNGMEYRAYSTFDFAGLSLTYLRAFETQKRYLAGIGLSGEYLLKDRVVTIQEDGNRFSYPTIQTYRLINPTGQLVGQFRPVISKKMSTVVELEYNFGLINFIKPITYQVSGDTAFSNGLFLNIGIFF